MTNGDGTPDEITVLIKVLDLLELSMRSRALSNNDAIQINQIINQFLGSSTGTVVQTYQASPGAEVAVGDEYNIGDHAQIGAVGKGAHVGQISFNMSEGEPSDSSMAALLDELAKLRLEMRRQAATSEDDRSIVAVGDAISSAEEGDTPQTLEHLRRAGKWALAIATSIGTGVAAAAIKTALGI
jgi:hypothetical protein